MNEADNSGLCGRPHQTCKVINQQTGVVNCTCTDSRGGAERGAACYDLGGDGEATTSRLLGGEAAIWGEHVRQNLSRSILPIRISLSISPPPLVFLSSFVSLSLCLTWQRAMCRWTRVPCFCERGRGPVRWPSGCGRRAMSTMWQRRGRDWRASVAAWRRRGSQ